MMAERERKQKRVLHAGSLWVAYASVLFRASEHPARHATASNASKGRILPVRIPFVRRFDKLSQTFFRSSYELVVESSNQTPLLQVQL